MYRSAVAVFFVSLALACAATTAVRYDGNSDNNNLLDAVLDRCSMGPGAVRCLKDNVLEFLEDGRRTGRGADDSAADIDERLVRATGEYIGRQVTEAGPTIARPGRAMDNNNNAEASVAAASPQQPTTTTTARGLDILSVVEFLKVVRSVFKFNRSLLKLKKSELNLAFIPFVADMEMGMMQDKMLMPLMMLMKMKLKMLMPIMMAVISMKATKALIISKVAIFLVLGFLVKEFLKKSGLPGLPLHLPGLPGSEPSTTASPPPPMYGPPQSSGYESSAGSWEPTGYSSHSSDSAHSMAYNSYLPSSSSSSAGSSSAAAGLSSTKY